MQESWQKWEAKRTDKKEKKKIMKQERAKEIKEIEDTLWFSEEVVSLGFTRFVIGVLFKHLAVK